MHGDELRLWMRCRAEHAAVTLKTCDPAALVAIGIARPPGQSPSVRHGAGQSGALRGRVVAVIRWCGNATADRRLPNTLEKSKGRGRDGRTYCSMPLSAIRDCSNL